MIFADMALARRLEEIDARCGAECARVRHEIRPGADTASVEVAGGFALYLGAGSPLNEAKGMGMAGLVPGDDLDAVIRVFHERGIPAKVMACPMADPSLLAGLAARGFRAAGHENVLYRPLDRLEVVPPPDDLEISKAGPEAVDVLAKTLARGFTAPEEPGPEMLEIVAMSSRVVGMEGLLASIGGEPVAAALLVIHGGVAMLAGASTQPAYRRRGIQSALAGARLALAASAGCDVATMGAEPGSTSQRNAERLGFQVAYTKLVLILDRP